MLTDVITFEFNDQSLDIDQNKNVAVGWNRIGSVCGMFVLQGFTLSSIVGAAGTLNSLTPAYNRTVEDVTTVNIPSDWLTFNETPVVYRIVAMTAGNNIICSDMQSQNIFYRFDGV